jgi:hypothetical protein
VLLPSPSNRSRLTRAYMRSRFDLQAACSQGPADPHSQGRHARESAEAESVSLPHDVVRRAARRVDAAPHRRQHSQ